MSANPHLQSLSQPHPQTLSSQSSQSHSQPQSQSRSVPNSRPRRRSSIAIDTAVTEPFPDFSPSVVTSADFGQEGASTSASVQSSAYALAGVASSPVAPSRIGRRPGDSADIEMEPIVGHRRRKSSALNMPTAAPVRPMVAAGGSRKHLSAGLADHSDILEANGGSSSTSAGSGNDDEARGRSSFSDDDLHSDEETGLSNKERARRQKKRRKITQLGQRIARDKSISAEERQEADKDVVRKLIINVVLILLWYFFSLSISLVSDFASAS